MEHFTRTWALGDLSDEEFDRVSASYGRYLASLDKGAAVWNFATSVSLNDAWIDQLNITPDVLSLSLLTGDLQRGYHHTELRYKGGRIVLGRDALDRAVETRPTEIWYDEFSGRPPLMAHRFMLVTPGCTEDRGEVHIEFADFEFVETPAASRTLPPLKP